MSSEAEQGHRVPLSTSQLMGGLGGTRFSRLVVEDCPSSTIDVCRARADEGAEEGLVVFAEEQGEGRGQRGRHWHSPPGLALYMSVLLRPPIAAREAEALMSLAGVAAAEAVRALGPQAMLKYPNDVVMPEADGYRKLAGLLVDTAIQGEELKYAIVSMGLNVYQREGDFPLELRGFATSLRMEGTTEPSREDAALSFLCELELRCRELKAGGGWAEALRQRHDELSWSPPGGRVIQRSDGDRE